MGTMPNIYPGYQSVANDEIRKGFEDAYGVKLPGEPGMDNIQMLEAIEQGDLKGMYIIGEDMAWVDADSNNTQDMLAKLDFLVVQDIFSVQQHSLLMSFCQVPHHLKKKEHLQILNGVSSDSIRHLKQPETASLIGRLCSCSQIKWASIGIILIRGKFFQKWLHLPLSSLIAIMMYWKDGIALDEGSMRGVDTPVLYAEDGFNFPDKKARFGIFEYVPPKEFPEEFDLFMNNGRLLEQFHEGI